MVCQKIKHVYRIVLSFRHSWTYTSRQLFNLTAGVDKSENIVAVPLRVHAVHSLIKKESVLYCRWFNQPAAGVCSCVLNRRSSSSSSLICVEARAVSKYQTLIACVLV
jgi:hypothetical protein